MRYSSPKLSDGLIKTLAIMWSLPQLFLTKDGFSTEWSGGNPIKLRGRIQLNDLIEALINRGVTVDRQAIDTTISFENFKIYFDGEQIIKIEKPRENGSAVRIDSFSPQESDDRIDNAHRILNFIGELKEGVAQGLIELGDTIVFKTPNIDFEKLSGDLAAKHIMALIKASGTDDASQAETRIALAMHKNKAVFENGVIRFKDYDFTLNSELAKFVTDMRRGCLFGRF